MASGVCQRELLQRAGGQGRRWQVVVRIAGRPQCRRPGCLPVQHHVRHSGTCDADERASELSRGASLALFRILQEALANAAKHARARRIIVALTRTDDVISLAVSDDGAGFDAGRLGTSGGLGLVMMRERASQLNGRFEFESAPGHGTIIRVVVPFR